MGPAATAATARTAGAGRDRDRHGPTALRLPPSARSSLVARSGAVAPIDSTVSVGDTLALRSVTPASANCSDWTAIDAVVRQVGARGIWLEDVSNAPGSFSGPEIQTMSDEFDDVIYAVDTDWFGEPGDFDENGRIVIVLSEVVNQIDPGLARPAPRAYLRRIAHVLGSVNARR